MFYNIGIVFTELLRFIKHYHKVFVFTSPCRDNIIFPQYSQLIEYCDPYTLILYEERKEKFITTWNWLCIRLEILLFDFRKCYMLYLYVRILFIFYIYVIVLIDKQFGEFVLQNGGNHFRALKARRLFFIIHISGF